MQFHGPILYPALNVVSSILMFQEGTSNYKREDIIKGKQRYLIET